MYSINNCLHIILRNLAAMAFLFSLTLIMGKKLVSQLNFFDFIAGITIGSIAAPLLLIRP